MLLNVLLWVAVLSAAGVFAYGELVRGGEFRRKAGLLERELSRHTGRAVDEERLVREREELTRALEEERGRFYAPGEIDPYRFGRLVRELLVRQGLEVGRYQTVEIGGTTHLEFAVSGDAARLMGFLEQVSFAGKYWSVPFLSIDGRAGAGRLECVVRIGYETLGNLDR